MIFRYITWCCMVFQMFSILLQASRGILNNLICVIWFSSNFNSEEKRCQEKRKDWILRIFTFNDKNSLYLSLILTLQFFWRSKWPTSNPISPKIIQNIPNIKNSEFKIKKITCFSKDLFIFNYFKFLDNASYNLWDQSSSPFFCCYSVNILQHWVGWKGRTYFCKVDYSRISQKFSWNCVSLNNLCEISTSHFKCKVQCKD